MFLYILVATIGMKMDIGSLIENWAMYGSAVSIGLLWMLVHIVVLLVVAKAIGPHSFLWPLDRRPTSVAQLQPPLLRAPSLLPSRLSGCFLPCWAMR